MSYKPLELGGRVAVVIGGTSGIGRAIAHGLAEAGADVVPTSRRMEQVEAAAAEIEGRGRRSLRVASDVADRDSLRRVLDASVEAFGKVDILVNSAGRTKRAPTVDFSEQDWNDIIETNLTGTLRACQVFGRHMLEREYGRIINIASLAGLVPAPAGHTLYAASKAFVIKFSEALAHEVRQSGVHVTALCPGFTLSEFHDVTGTRDRMKRLPPWLWMDAATVARQGFDAVMAGTPIYVNGRVNRTIATLVRFTPEWLVRSISRRVGRTYRKL